MGAIAGLVRLDGAPADRDAVLRLSRRTGRALPHGMALHVEGACGFAHGEFAVSHSAGGQPLVDADAALVLTFDGRLDNRSDLVRDLEQPSGASDAALVLAAYQRWGPQAVAKLLGDFAFAIWDGRKRVLLCGRDIAGVRPLHYRVGAGWVAFASDLDTLAAGILPVPEPNEGMIGEYLAAFLVSQHDTPFSGINRVPPAHYLLASARGTTLHNYWQPDPNRVIRYRRDEEYEEHFRSLLRDAVAARLRTPGPSGILLSGGVDSSSITGVAAELCAAKAVTASRIETFSMSLEVLDEQPFFESVSRQWHVTGHRVMGRRPQPDQFRDETARSLEIEIYPNSPTLEPVWALAASRGIGTLLTGLGGDDWLGPGLWAYADLLGSGRLVALYQRARAAARATDFVGWSQVSRAMVWPLVPVPLRSAIKRALGRGQPPPWIEPAFAARNGLAERLAQRDVRLKFPTHEQGDMWREGASGMIAHSLETIGRGGARFGIEHAHPFFDRRVIEFGLAIPADQRWRNGRHKDLVRRAMARHLPSGVSSRLSSPSADHALALAIEAETGRELPGNLEVVRKGWIRESQLRELHRRTLDQYHSGDAGYVSPAWIVWNIVAVNLWLEAVKATRIQSTQGDST